LLGRVVLEDVAHVGGCLNADFVRRDQLDVVELLVRVEAAFNRLLAHAGDSTWASVVGRKCEERPIRFAKLRVEVSGHQLSMCVPRVDIRLGEPDIAELNPAPVAGINCMTPVAPTAFARSG
jgi:hypothetical protein